MTCPVFISYSHRDKAQKDKLLRHFGVLEDSASIQVWTDDAIGAGREWQTEIDQALSQAAAAVLLISADFLSSPFILHKEVPSVDRPLENRGLEHFSYSGEALCLASRPVVDENAASAQGR